ncbi:MAG: PAS domain S-box protein [Bacteroidales bacterium]|nr:PAS domain S-box protein [Bacteroidales bacterium]
MSLKKIEEKRQGDQYTQEDNSEKSNEKLTGNADKKLLSGTVQFYEDILTSVPDTFIAIYNKTGKHLEVWIDHALIEKTGLDASYLKGKTVSAVYSKKASSTLEQHISSISENGEKTRFNLLLDLPQGNFNFHVQLSLLPAKSKEQVSIAAVFVLLSERNVEHDEHFQAKAETDFLEPGQQSVWIETNPKGVISRVSDGFVKLSGYSEEHLQAYKISHLPMIEPSDSTSFDAVIKKSNSAEAVSGFEWEWQNKNGLRIWSQVSIIPRYEDSFIRGFQFIFTDISSRKKLENELLKSKQTYKTVIENAGEAIFILQDDRVKFCNTRWVDLLQVPMDQLSSGPFSGYVHPEDREQFNSYLVKGNKQNNFKEFNFRVTTLQNEIKYLHTSATLIEWQNMPAMLFYATDSTALLSKEKQLNVTLQNADNLLDFIWELSDISLHDNAFELICNKLFRYAEAHAVLILTYENHSDYPTIKAFTAIPELIDKLKNAIDSTEKNHPFEKGLGHVRNISFGKVTKYSDGVFESGNGTVHATVMKRIGELVKTSGIYVLGFAMTGKIYGNAMLFMPEGKIPQKQYVLESIARLSGGWLSHRMAAEQLRSSEKKYRRVFDSLLDVYFSTDIDGIITEVSPSVKDFTGYEPVDLIGRLITDFYSTDESYEIFNRKLLQLGRITDYDIQCNHKNGDIIHASLNVKLVYDANGRVAGSEGFLRDISSRKKAEEKFLKSEQKFRTLADFTYDWEYWISNEGEILYMSHSCEEISGYSAREFISNPALLRKIVHEDDYDTYQTHAKFAETPGSDEVINFDFRIISRNHTVKWINQINREVFDNEGNSLGRRISNRDITERKISEQELRNSEERFRTLFYESPDAIFVEDFDGVILDVNPAACDLQKMTREELIGRNITDLIPEEHKEKVVEDFPKWLTGEVKNYKGFLLKSTGQIIPVEIHGSQINYSGRKALLFIVRDITEVVEKEKQLRESIERAEEADMLKSAFLANVSHEIRTPMNAIIGFSEILTNQDLSKKEREEFIQYITQGSNTLMNLIEDIIDITKIEAGQIKVEFEDCNVSKLLDELYATFLKMKNKNGHQEVELRLNKPTVDSGFSIHTDPNRIRQILSNLLGNALKFTKKGYIELGFNLRDPNQIIFYVKDTGIGIPEDKQDLIFERFGQVSEGRKNGGPQGTGLGLSISKKLAELLGGSLSVKSDSGKGSTFYLSLPVEEMEADTDKMKVSAAAANSVIDWSDKLFLIAEDSILNYTFLEALFQKTKVNLVWAKNGKEAVELCQKNKKIDLVLMDIKMPVLDGLEAIAAIKTFSPELPIIVQTAYAMPEDRERSLKAGGDEHLTKPIQPEELFATIKKFIG